LQYNNLTQAFPAHLPVSVLLQASNLRLLMDRYQTWAQDLYRDYTFADFAEAVERLGHKGEVKVHSPTCPLARLMACPPPCTPVGLPASLRA